MTDADLVFMREALDQAAQAQAQGEVPVGAVVVCDGKVLGRGFNRTISRSDPTAHAEIVALRQACEHLNNYRLPPKTSMYSTIEPCTMCAGALIHARLSELIFAATEPRAGAAGSSIDAFNNPGLNHHVMVRGGVMADEAAALMTRFFRDRR